MQTYTFTLKPLSAFSTEILGDTLFGQLCWAIRNHHGEGRLTKLLDGYTDGSPFMVVSDAFPSGHIPKPSVPAWFFEDANPELRKLLKKKVWMPLEKIDMDLSKWQGQCKSPSELLGAEGAAWSKEDAQPHNTINRLSGTTGTGEFAPYSVELTHYDGQAHFDCHIVLDEERFDIDSLCEALQNIGHFGFGKDATIGAGKFEVVGEQRAFDVPNVDGANASLTLAPCAPQGLGYDSTLSFYQPFTRFGRHGDIAVHQSGKPFKSPVLMAKTGSIFGINAESGYIGQGLGGAKQKISSAIPETVQQGYCPVVPLRIPLDLVKKITSLENDL